MFWIRLAIFQGVAGAWLRNLFSSSTARAERYRQAVSEQAFETWMTCGDDFDTVIAQRIAAAEQCGAHSSVRYWQDVFASAHDFNSHPENRRKRNAMTVCLDEEAAA